jgi:predicted flap endonuclease-1-like 5' DNA nuclease
MMRQAGGRAVLVDGVWRFEGLGPAQSSALRESLVFRAYQEVLLGLARLDAEAKGAASAPAERSGLPQGTGVAEVNERAEVRGGAQAVARPEPSQRLANAESAENAANAGQATSATPVTTFRTKLKIKPVGGRGEAPPTEAAPTVRPQATAPPREAVRTAAVSNDVADDLTRIRSINRALAQRLIAADVTSFRQIANWDSGEVRRIARDLDLDKRIWRENWIEQAALLAGRAEREARAEQPDEQPALIGSAGAEARADTPVEQAEAWPVEDGGEAARAHDEATEAGVGQAAASGADDEPSGAQEPLLPDIAGREAALVPAVASALPQAMADGAAAAEPTAAATVGPGEPDPDASAPDVAERAEGLGSGEVDVEVPPAAAAAESKAAAADISDRERVRIALMAPSPTFTTPEGVSGIRLHAGREAGNDNAEPGPSAAVEPTRASVKAGRQARRLPPPSLRRLTYIRGVTDEVAERLRSSGVHSLEEIAAWAQSDVQWFRAILGDGARISADQWIEQAHMLASGRWTRYALLLEQGLLPTTLVPRPEPVAARRRLPVAASVDAPAGDVEAMVEDAAPVATTAAAEPDADDGMLREVASKEVPEAAVARDMPLSVSQEEGVAAVVSESDGPPGEGAVSTDDGDGVGADEVVVLLDVSSAVEPAQVAAEPGPSAEGDPQQDQARITPEAVSAPKETGPDDAGGAEASTAAASSAPMVVVPPRPARPAASLFADELVSSLTPGAVSREPVTARDAAPPEEPGRTAVSAQGVAGDFGPVDEAVGQTPDSDMATPPAADPAVAGAEETSHLLPEGSDDAGKRDIEEGAAPDFAVGLLDAEDDFEDEEVLVVRRTPAAGPDPAQAKAAEGDDPSGLVETGASEASLDAGRPEASSAGGDMAADDVGEDEFTPLGEEASVRIVSRQVPADERTEAAPDVPAVPGPAGLEEEGVETKERSLAARERLGYSPEYIARRLDVSDDEDEGEDYAGYRDAVEEATVTIIRAKGREEPASAVVPDRIANDQAGSPEDTDSGADEPRKRTFGSRFLRALTGE